MSTLSRFSGLKNDDNTFRVLSGDYQTPAYAATIALVIKPYAHRTIVNPAVLTGVVTFSTVLGTQAADDNGPFVGDTIQFLLTPDGTTRVVTFGTGFLPNGTLSVTTAKYATISFIFNGTAWIETGRTVTA